MTAPAVPPPSLPSPIPITQRTPATIEAVIEQFDAIVDWAEQAASPLGYFPALYVGVTKRVLAGVAQRFFDDGTRMGHFDTTFASRYLTALDDWQHGRPLTESWRLAFDAAADDELIVLQHLILAINAHMRLDLGVTAATLAPGTELGSLLDDFDRINDVLDGLVPGDKTSFERISPVVHDLDRDGRLSDALVDAVIADWRQRSWANATRLAPLVGDAFRAGVEAIDHEIAADGAPVRHPDRLVRDLLDAVRATEPRDPAEIVRALRAGDAVPMRIRPVRPPAPVGPHPPPPEQHRVVIIGAGVGGLTAAHELAERGFAVTVVEDRPLVGGKARSYPVGATSTDGRPGLPGEHGFRFFAGFYRHVIDTMDRIPAAGGPSAGSVLDHLVDAEQFEIVRDDHPAVLWSTHPPRSIGDVRRFFESLFGGDWGVSPSEVLFLADRIVTLLSSCDDRWFHEWEHVAWWTFVGAETRSPGYQQLVGALTRPFVAARATEMSTRTGGHVVLRLMASSFEPWGHEDRVLDGPTSERWHDPWRTYLEDLGVTFRLGTRASALRFDGQHVSGVEVHPSHATDLGEAREVVEADWYVLALPADQAAPLLAPQAVVIDPGLAGIAQLRTAWMSGVQLYLACDVTMAPGHVLHLDSPWALTSISQAQFWPDVKLAELGDGRVRGILSVDICDFDTPGLNGKAARDCTRDEIVHEVIAQLVRGRDEAGQPLIDPADVIDAHIDDDIQWPNPGDEVNAEPMLINTVDSWSLRPDATTAIPNLFLASDYVRTNTDLATMEGANEAGRRAVNGILTASGAAASPCRIWTFDHPLWTAGLRALDQLRWTLFDRPHGG